MTAETTNKYIGDLMYKWRVPKTESLGFMWVGIAIAALCPISFLFVRIDFGVMLSALGLFFGLVIFLNGYQQLRNSRNQVDIFHYGITVTRAGHTTAYEWSELKEGRLRFGIYRGVVLMYQIRLTLPDDSYVHFFHKGTIGTNIERADTLDFVIERVKMAGVRLQIRKGSRWVDLRDLKSD